jgi:Uma2 family endonuclease
VLRCGGERKRMGRPSAKAYVSYADYFEAEETSEERHEWIDGIVYAMSRGTPEHGRLVSAINGELRAALKGSCTVYSESTMLYVQDANVSTYADVTIVCGPVLTMTVKRNGASLGEAVTNPTVIVEVLSPSTERYDRQEKFGYYKHLATLQEYVLVSQDTRRIEVFRRPADAQGAWSCEEAREGDTVDVHGVTIVVDAVYA